MKTSFRRPGLSADGDTLVASGAGAGVQFLEAETGRAIGSLRGGNWAVTVIAVSRENQIAVGRKSETGGELTLHDLETRETLRRLDVDEQVNRLSFSPDGSLLAASIGGSGARIWNTADWTVLYDWPRAHVGMVTGLSFAPGSHLLATSSFDATVKVWDLKSGECQRTIRGHYLQCWSVAFSPDGSLLASGGGEPDGSVRVFETTGWREVLRVQILTRDIHARGIPAPGIPGLAWLPQGPTLVSVSYDGTVRFLRGGAAGSARAAPSARKQ